MALPGFTSLLVFAALALLLPFGILGLSALVRPRAPKDLKLRTYESGEIPVGTAWIQYNVRYYLFALIFVVFDVETVFLYPWAVAYRMVGLFGFLEALVFIAILLVGLAYAWRKGALEWV